jgi:membrane-associated phospholipid phosphatase
MAAATRTSTARSAALGGLALHDWMALIFLGALAAGLLTRAPGADASWWALFVWLGVATVVLATRSHPRPGRLFGLGYRLALLFGLMASYVLLKSALAILSPNAFDAELARIDAVLFRVQWEEVGAPSAFWSEYFAFFYLSYFGVLLLYAIPHAIFGRDARAAGELAIAMVLVYCVGQSLYLAVPALGPGPYYGLMTEVARGPVSTAMMRIVEALGAQKDVFPSLHVAATVAAAAHARRRGGSGRAARLIALGLAFVALNVTLSTLYLRWHYVVDTIAGAVLGLGADRASVRILRWEAQRRTARGVQVAWP